MHPESLIQDSRLTGTVLFVDDDDGVRKVLSRWAEDLGHRVHVAANAEDAMAVMQRGPIDVAVCDVRMPGHDGIWLVDQLRRNYPYTSVALATGVTELDPMVTLRPGVVGYIIKPFNRDELEAVIQRGLVDCRDRAASRPVQRSLPAGDDSPRTTAQGGDPSPRLLCDAVVDGIILARY
jgi:DNA-binding NtrC family response regulator